jgi:hypothetical protein
MVHASDFWLVDVNTSEENATVCGSAADGAAINGEKSTKMSSSVLKHYEEETILYQWGTMTAVRRFCRTCGVLPFYPQVESGWICRHSDVC